MTVAPTIEPRGKGAHAKNPWLGPRFYEEGDRDFFYGRDLESQELLRAVRRNTLTVLFGTSGLGKTSLINAGLLPLLRDDGFFPVRVVFQYKEDGEDDVAELVDQIISQIKANLEPHSITEEPRSETLKQDMTLWEYLHRVRFWHHGQLVTPVIILDQFEDVFRHGPKNERNIHWTREVIQQLADLIEEHLPSTVRQRVESGESLPFAYDFPAANVVFSLREEYLADLEDLSDKIPSLRRSERCRLTEMRGTQAKSAIVEPGHVDKIIDEALAVEIIKKIGVERQHGRHLTSPGEPDGDLERWEVEPFLLSMVCSNLNEQRLRKDADHITLDQVSEVQKNILGPFYEECLRGITPGVRQFIENELVDASGYRLIVAQRTALSRPEVTKLELDRLEERRLLRYSEDRHGLALVELSHDRLLETVCASRKRRIEEERIRKEEERRRKEKAERRKRWLRRGLGCFCLILAVAWIRATRLQEAVPAVGIQLDSEEYKSPSPDSPTEVLLWPPQGRRESRTFVAHFTTAITDFSWHAIGKKADSSTAELKPAPNSTRSIQCEVPLDVTELELTSTRHDWVYSYNVRVEARFVPPGVAKDFDSTVSAELRAKDATSALKFDSLVKVSKDALKSRLGLKDPQKQIVSAYYSLGDGDEASLQPMDARGESKDLSLAPNAENKIVVHARTGDNQVFKGTLRIQPDLEAPKFVDVQFLPPQSPEGCYDVASGDNLKVIVAANEAISEVTVSSGERSTKLARTQEPARYEGDLRGLNLVEGKNFVSIVVVDMFDNDSLPHRETVEVNSKGPTIEVDEGTDRRGQTLLAVGMGRVAFHLQDANGIKKYTCEAISDSTHEPLDFRDAPMPGGFTIALGDVRKLWQGTLKIVAWDSYGRAVEGEPLRLEVRPHETWREEVEWQGITWVNFQHAGKWLYMTKTEISNRQYKAIYDQDKRLARPLLWTSKGFPEYLDLNDKPLEAADFPVVGLTPNEAGEFAKKLKAHLPNDLEWLTAARKDNPHGEHPWKDDEEGRLRCNYYKSWEKTTPWVRSTYVKAGDRWLVLHYSKVHEEGPREGQNQKGGGPPPVGPDNPGNIALGGGNILPIAGPAVENNVKQRSSFVHMLGNVAEIVSVAGRSEHVVVGGHFDDKYEDLSLSNAKVPYYQGEDGQPGPGSYRIGFRLVIEVNAEETDRGFRDEARKKE